MHPYPRCSATPLHTSGSIDREGTQPPSRHQDLKSCQTSLQASWQRSSVLTKARAVALLSKLRIA